VNELDTILTDVTYALGQLQSGQIRTDAQGQDRISSACDALTRCQSALANRTIQVNDWVVCPRCGERERVKGSEVHHAPPICPAKLDSGGDFEF
jgi:hypothetical protein